VQEAGKLEKKLPGGNLGKERKKRARETLYQKTMEAQTGISAKFKRRGVEKSILAGGGGKGREELGELILFEEVPRGDPKD